MNHANKEVRARAAVDAVNAVNATVLLLQLAIQTTPGECWDFMTDSVIFNQCCLLTSVVTGDISGDW